jgi:glycosyltransferase involved in cell wall biosynthesis
MRCLWIGRDLPWPADAGDKIYSLGLAKALAGAGADVMFLGHGSDATDTAGGFAVVPVRHGKRGKLAALASPLPFVAATLATQEYRTTLREQLLVEWDVALIDGYASGWALTELLRWRRRDNTRLIVHVSHNNESRVWTAMADLARSGPVRRWFATRNLHKVRALERQLLEAADVVTAITSEDAESFRDTTQRAPVVLPPGYEGRRRAERLIGSNTGRSVLLMGSYRWAVKEENLKQFLQVADSRFAAHDIHLDVVGDINPHLRASVQPGLKATTIHGFVDDPAPFLDNARMGVVPEVIGGGFKLKFLDYIFNRIPVATIDSASAGLDQSVRAHVLCADGLENLVERIIENIDDVDGLQAMQSHAYEAAINRYEWAANGDQLKTALQQQPASRLPSD